MCVNVILVKFHPIVLFRKLDHMSSATYLSFNLYSYTRDNILLLKAVSLQIMEAHSGLKSILIINPNTTESMTTSLRPLVDSLGFREVSLVHTSQQDIFLIRDKTRFEYFTAPTGVPSINNEDDAVVSATACLPALTPLLHQYDGFLVCCYSQHPLVAQLRRELADAGLSGKAVAGIFEASIAACLQSINIDQKFGIVSTGMQWSSILESAVAELLGSKHSLRYAGTETTGLNANELHTASRDEVHQRMKQASKRLLVKDAKAICLGCAGMAGMRQSVHEACIEQLGNELGSQIKIIDGVVTGVVFIEGQLRAGQ